MTAHVTGLAVVVVEPCEKANQHVARAHQMAASDGHRLLRFSVEPAEA